MTVTIGRRELLAALGGTALAGRSWRARSSRGRYQGKSAYEVKAVVRWTSSDDRI